MRISAIALVLILISGCAELNRTVYSQSLETEAKPFPRILSFTKPYVIVPIPLDEAVLRITLHNAVTSVSFLFVGLVLPIPLPTDDSDSNVFHMHISASPNTDSISINPFNVVLHIHNRKASPSIVTMSAPFQGEVSAEKATILITETTHLDLFFPIPPINPEEPFELEINGVAIGQQPITVPLIHFQTASIWSYHMLPIFR